MADPTTIMPLPAAGAQARPLLGLMLRLLAMVMLGIMFALVKLAGEADVHVIEIIFWRQLAGLPAVLLWLFWTGKLHEIRTAHPAPHALRAILGVTAMALNFTAMLMMPMAEATTISFASPIFATVLAALLLGEPTGRYRWGAVVLGFTGVVLAMQPGGNMTHGIGPWIALAGAVLSAGVYIQIRRMSRAEGAGAIVFWFSLSTLAPLGIGMLFFADGHDLHGWLIIAGLGCAGAIAQLLLTSAMRHASVAAISTMDYTGLIWSIVFGMLIFGDLPGPGTWLGAPVIILAGLVIVWREQQLGKERINSA